MLFGTRKLDLKQEPQVMGILNVTPDSFSDGGQFLGLEAALSHARRLVVEGATIIDVGGESTRPGALPVSVQEELDRVCPVVEAIAKSLDVVISVDTSTPQVITESAKLGAGLINDVRALGREGAREAVAATGLPVCLMHMQGEPASMQERPQYRDVVGEVVGFLQHEVSRCEAAGIPGERILLDPGFGFGKSLTHNLLLLKRLDRVVALGYPVLVGVSRKSMIGGVLEKPVGERLFGSLAAASIAVEKGAAIVRAHDVRENVDAVRFAAAVRRAEDV